MSVTVRLKDGHEDVVASADDFAMHDDGTLSLFDKTVGDDTADDDAIEVAVYVPGSWIRARIDGLGT